MAENNSDNRYKPKDLEKDDRAPIPISLSDSNELWLIQMPINQLQPAEFHGKDLSLKLYKDGKVAKFENSSGKSYEVVSYANLKPDATVFFPSSSDSKIVGKFSRRVCLVHYPEPGEYDEQKVSNPKSSSLRLQGSKTKTFSHFSTMHHNRSKTGTDISTETLTCDPSIGHGILETPVQQSRKKKHRDSAPASDSTRSIGQSSLASSRSTKSRESTPPAKSRRSVGRSSLASQPENQTTAATIGSTHLTRTKPKLKKHKS